MANIAVLTKGTAGDVVPLLAAACALRDAKHQITLVSHYGYRALVEAEKLAFVALDTELEWSDFQRDLRQVNTPQGSVAFFRRQCLSRISREFRILDQLCSVPGTILLSRHMATLADLFLVEKRPVLLARVYTAPSQPRLLGSLAQLLSGPLCKEINQVRASLGLGLISDFKPLLSLPAANIGNWPEWFASSLCHSLGEATRVGFLTHSSLESGVIPCDVRAFLEGDGAPILISAGTGDFLGSEFYSVAADACAQLDRKALLVSHVEYPLPQRIAAIVKWVSHLPFASVMPHVAAVVHHGGMGTIARACSDGVPQLILPYGADRPDNATHVRALGTGDYLLPHQWSVGAVAEALGRVLSSKSISSNCAAVADRISRENAVGHVGQTIQQIAQGLSRQVVA